MLEVTTSSYWLDHYQFDKVSPKKKKQLSKPFIDLLIINAIVPIQFIYFQCQGKENSEELMQLVQDISPEKIVLLINLTFLVLLQLMHLKPNPYCN